VHGRLCGDVAVTAAGDVVGFHHDTVTHMDFVTGRGSGARGGGDGGAGVELQGGGVLVVGGSVEGGAGIVGHVQRIRVVVIHVHRPGGSAGSVSEAEVFQVARCRYGFGNGGGAQGGSFEGVAHVERAQVQRAGRDFLQV